MQEAGNQEKVFTPLIGKGVKFFFKGRPADDILLCIKKVLKNIEDGKIRYQEIIDLFNEADDAIDYKYFSKQDLASIKSTINEVKNIEKAKLSD